MIERETKVVNQTVDAVKDAAAELAAEVFVPRRVLRNGTVQTLLSTMRPAQLGRELAEERLVVVDGGTDETAHEPSARLFGYYNRRRTPGPSRGLVISLHGWEGSSHSLYNLVIGSVLLDEGYDMFRLNLRDHGPSLHLDPHRLNQGVFLGTLLGEAHRAVQQIARWAGDKPVFLTGPSLGGNFALRIAARHAAEPVHNLRLTVAVSPAINPARATDRIDTQPHFRHYFRSRWAASLVAKQAAFPHLYDFGPAFKLTRIRAMTDWLVRHYTAYANADDYLYRYAVLGDALTPVNTPTTIIAAQDDPVISADDFALLTPNPLVTMKLPRYGGHVGFMDVWPLRHVLPQLVLEELAKAG